MRHKKNSFWRTWDFLTLASTTAWQRGIRRGRVLERERIIYLLGSHNPYGNKRLGAKAANYRRQMIEFLKMLP